MACPVCGTKTQERLINSHLDQCLSGFNSTDSPPPASSPGLPLHQPLSSTSPAPLPHAIIYEKSKTLPKLPKFVFSIMSDKQLRKKLKDYHLSPHGNRGFLMARLKEFTLRYKAEYDSLHPKTGRCTLIMWYRIQSCDLTMPVVESLSALTHWAERSLSCDLDYAVI